jgi:hypothetical protein
MTRAMRLYNICKNDIRLFTKMCCNTIKSEHDYSLYVTRIIEDFLMKYTYYFVNMDVFSCYMESAVLASIWIIDKYIEDDHLYISDIVELVRNRVDKHSIILVESEIFFLCRDIRIYIT